MPDSQTASQGTMRGRRVLVVGGGGFIGGHVVRRLLAEGAAVVVFDVIGNPSPKSDLEWVVGSTSNASLVASAAGGCDAVVFLANSSLPGSAHADLTAEVDAHVKTTIQVAEICNSLGVERFVFASSGGTVYGIDSTDPIPETAPTIPRNAYGVSKLAIENYLRVLGGLRSMKTISLRISNPYGDGQTATRAQGFIAAAMRHAMHGTTLEIWGDGSVERDFIYVGDVADAFSRAIVYAGEDSIFNIGSGVPLSLLEILGHVEHATGRKIDVAFSEARSVDVRRNFLDITRARTALGWQPETPLETGLQRTSRWWITKARTDE